MKKEEDFEHEPVDGRNEELTCHYMPSIDAQAELIVSLARNYVFNCSEHTSDRASNW